MMTGTTISSLIPLKEEFKSVYKATADEIKYFIDDGIQEYAVNQRSKFEKTKTFFYRDTPVNFYDVFFPLNLNGKDSRGKNYLIDIEKNIKQIFDNENNFITILGNVGSGKSMLVKHIFLHFLKQEMEIPIFVELRDLNSFDGSFYDKVKEIIFNNRLSPNDKILERLMSDGKFLFLLDGYDELYEDKISHRKNEINQFIDKYRKNYYVITSRPGANIELLPRFTNLNISNIEKEDIQKFVSKQLSIIGEEEIFGKRIMETIESVKNEDYADYLINPLLLTMFIFTFRNHPEIPKSKSKFYYNVFDTLYYSQDAVVKQGDRHERKTNLKMEEFEDILKWFSYFSFYERKYNFDKDYLVSKLKDIKQQKGFSYDIENLIYDLTVSISIIMIDGTKYTFPHRSLQEYFVSLLISKQTDDIKMRIYESKYLNELDYNLWILSYELDSFIFGHFLIQKLNDLINFLDDTTPKKRIIKYLNLTNGVTEQKRKDGTQENNDQYILTFGLTLVNRKVNPTLMLMNFWRYFGNKGEDIFPKFLTQTTLETHIQSKMDLLKNKIVYTEMNQRDIYKENMGDNIIIGNGLIIVPVEEMCQYFYKYLCELGLNVFVDNMIEKLKKEKEKLEQNIILTQQQNDILLNL